MLADLLRILAGTALLEIRQDLLRADVGRHDQDRVLEVDRPALGVRDPAVVQDLQQHVEDIRVGLLDLVEEHDRVGLPADRFRQLAALLIAHISGRRSDQAGDRVLLHVFAHVDADHVLLVVEQCLGQRLRQLRLADARGAEEEEGTDRLGRVLDARFAAEDRLGDHGHGLVLADDAPVQLVLQVQGLGALALRQLADRDPRPAGDDAADLVLRHAVADQGQVVALQRVLLLLQFLAEGGQFTVLQLGRPVQVPVLLRDLDLPADRVDLLADPGEALHLRLLILPAGLLHAELVLQLRELLLQLLQALPAQGVLFLLQRCDFDLHLEDPALLLVQLLRKGIHLRLDERAGFIDQIDRLIREKTVRNIPVGQHRRAHERVVHDLDAVVDLVALFQASQDRDGVLHGRLRHKDRLEAALQSGVLLDILPVLLEGRRADAVQLASGQHGLEHVAGVHGALGLAGADDGVQFVHEEQDLPVAVLHVLEDRLQALLELASVLGARHQGAHIQGEDLLVLQALRDVPARDPLGQALHDRGLADAGLTDQDGIVLGLPGQDADDVADLRVAADDGIHLLVPRLRDELLPVLLQRVVGRLRVVGGHALIAAHGGKRLQEAVAVDAVLPEDGAERPVRVAQQGQEEVLDADVVVSQLLRLIFRAQQRLVERSADVDLAVAALHLRQLRERSLDARREGSGVDAHLLDELEDQAVLDRQKAVEQVCLLDGLVAVVICEFLTAVHGLCGFLCEFLDVHRYPSLCFLFYAYYNTYNFCVNTPYSFFQEKMQPHLRRLHPFHPYVPGLTAPRRPPSPFPAVPGSGRGSRRSLPFPSWSPRNRGARPGRCPRPARSSP